MHLVGFIIRIYHDARSPERQILLSMVLFMIITVAFNLISDARIPSLQFVCVKLSILFEQDLFSLARSQRQSVSFTPRTF